MKLGVSKEPVQSGSEVHSCRAGRQRLEGRIIDFADVLVPVRVMLVGGLARPREPGGSGVEAPAVVAWTSSSGISVQACRMDMVADVGRRWRRRPGWGRPGVNSVRNGVLLVVSHLEVAVFL